MEKSKSLAVASFVFGMTFWIPLLNLIFGMFAVILGLKALSKIKKNPEAYSGRWFAIAGMALGAIVYIGYATGLGMCFSGYKEICESIGLTFLS